MIPHDPAHQSARRLTWRQHHGSILRLVNLAALDRKARISTKTDELRLALSLVLALDGDRFKLRLAGLADLAPIVAGDTNLHSNMPYDSVPLSNLLSEAGLTDVCRALECGDERIDRVMYRNSDSLWLTPLEWSIPPEFVDAEGNDLSDHEPVAVRLGWERL